MADEKVKDRKDKKKKEPGRVRRWFKDFFSELKKVTWPSFSKVVKQTGIVLLVTVIFLLVMMAFDALLGTFYNDFLIKGLGSDTVVAFSALIRSGGGLL
ncbi:MAG: preprotein translocase subunit SecE [Clostridiales bacterium]|nr:preprotein translocase subunit SecE [Clostridiales bacterium]